jgi:hypothetical protein
MGWIEHPARRPYYERWPHDTLTRRGDPRVGVLKRLGGPVDN